VLRVSATNALGQGDWSESNFEQTVRTEPIKM
jgi:hypothetical protein